MALVTNTKPLSMNPTTASGERVIAAEIPIDKEDIETWGPILLAYFLIFIVANAIFIGLIYKNWRNLRDSPYFCSNLFCLFLTSADLAVAVLVGFPASMHMTWPEYFGKFRSMRLYSYFSFLMFEYTFLLRIIIIAAISIDKCLHVLWPLRYTFNIVSDAKVYLASFLMIAFPVVVRVIPNILYVLRIEEGPILQCLYYLDKDVSVFHRVQHKIEYRIPLTCSLDAGNERPAIFVFELVVLATVTMSAFLIIVVVDVMIFVSLSRNKVTVDAQAQKRRAANFHSMMIRTLVVTVTFTITNLPYVVIWLHDFIYKINISGSLWISNALRFKLILLTFLSLIFHPWLYSLKMKSLRNILPRLKRTITKSTYLTSMKSIATGKRKESDKGGLVISNPASPSPDNLFSENGNDIIMSDA